MGVSSQFDLAVLEGRDAENGLDVVRKAIALLGYPQEIEVTNTIRVFVVVHSHGILARFDVLNPESRTGGVCRESNYPVFHADLGELFAAAINGDNDFALIPFDIRDVDGQIAGFFRNWEQRNE